MGSELVLLESLLESLLTAVHLLVHMPHALAGRLSMQNNWQCFRAESCAWAGQQPVV